MMNYKLLQIKSEKDLNFFRNISEKIEEINEDIIELSKSMLDIMYKNDGIGIAGTMIGVLKRIIAVDLQENNNKNPIVLINPEIIWKSENKSEYIEGSISIKSEKGSVSRPTNIKVKYLDLQNNEKILEAGNLLSVCLQHQIDYLDGKLFFDYFPKEERNEIINKIKNPMRIKIITKDDEVLRNICENIVAVDEDIKNTLDHMLDFMYNNKGIGLAANQVGILKRLIVIDLQENDNKDPYFLINPEIIYKSIETESEEEGCLSIPNERAKVLRHKKIKVKYLDKNNKENVIEAEGLFARCLQHEIDHLNGKVFTDHLSKLKRDMILSRIKKHK